MPFGAETRSDEANLVPSSPWKALVGVAVFVFVYALTGGLDPRQRAVAATFSAAVFLWISEAIPLAMTAMLSTVALVATGALGAKEAFGAYGDQIILLFIGSFILAKAMEESSLDKRLALFILSRKWATRSSSTTLFAIGAVACAISLFVSNTATTAMLLPITLTMIKTLSKIKGDTDFSISFLLFLSWGSSVAVGTIIGTPPNVLGVGLIRKATGTGINFVDWAMFAMPITVVMLAIGWLVLRVWDRTRLDASSAREVATTELAALGKVKPSELATIAGFGIAIVLWLVPGLVEYAIGSQAELSKLLSARIPEAVAALLGASALFFIPCSDTPSRRAMTWQSATMIEWGTILLFAGGLALGKAAFDSGLAKLVGESAAAMLGAKDVWTITALAIGMSIILSELASNTASASIMVPVAIAIATGAGVNPVPAALGAVIGSNLGFMLPISTPPNAIVYSTGMVPGKEMIKRGFVFDVIGFLVTLGCLRLILPLIGLS
jgi:sodium-dependent dicarboxylate transporter 2/3/5